MSSFLLAIIVGVPLAWHLGLTVLTYYDAGNVGLEPPKKWAAITFLVPVFGFFIYLFERSELSYDPDTDPYRGNNYNVHPSRADDAPLRSRGDDRLSPEGTDRDQVPTDEEPVAGDRMADHPRDDRSPEESTDSR